MPSLDTERLRREAKRLLAGFTNGQKATVVIALVTIIAGGYLFMQWAAKPSYTTLFTDLDATDASQITEKLTAKGVPYHLADNGQTIEVPGSQVYQLRLDLSAQGLPSSGGPGYALLDKQGITTSEFQQHVNYQRALEGELAKTINAIDDVDGASVHLVVPQQDVFATDNKKASASVLVKTAPSAPLAAGEVQAIVNLVASSVSGMRPQDVTVADTKGRVLSAPGVNQAAATDLRAGQTGEFEAGLAGSVQEMLDQVIGTGAAVVRVNADLDFDQKASTSERYENGLARTQNQAGSTTSATSANAAQPLQEQTSKETYSGGAASAGTLGVDGTVTPGAGSTTYDKSEANRTFALDKITEEVRAAPGTVKRLSVALLLDSHSVSPGQLTSLKRAVGAAVGLDAKRGDQLEITRIAFDTRAKKDATEIANSSKSSDTVAAAGRYGLALAIVILVLVLAWRATKRAALRRPPVRVPVDLLALEGADGLSPAFGAEAALEPVALALPEPAAGPDDADLLNQQVDDLIDAQPEEVTATLRGWLADRRQ